MVRAVFGRAPTASTAQPQPMVMAGFNLFAAPPEPEKVVEIWPEHWQGYRVLRAMDTQWRVGMSGRTGLDYSALPEVWRRLKVPVAERDEAFACLQELESEALRLLAEQQP